MRLPLHPHRAQSRLKPGELLQIVKEQSSQALEATVQLWVVKKCHCEGASPKQSLLPVRMRLLRRFAPRNDGWTHTRI